MASESKFNNLKRVLTMFEKTIDRITRNNYYDPKQHPEIIKKIKATIHKIRAWIRSHELFSDLNEFYTTMASFIKELGALIVDLWEVCKPKPGKKLIPKARRRSGQKKIFDSINKMVKNLSKMIGAKDNTNPMAVALEQGAEKSFLKKIILDFKKKLKNLASQRGQKTYIFPWKDVEEYHSLLKDKKRFRTEVVDKLSKHMHATGHLSSCKCKGPKKYVLCGYRKEDRKVIMSNDKQEIFRIRMIKCIHCRQRFSLIPSFLPREKNFGIDIIGNVCRNMCLFSQSIQGAMESIKIIGKKSVKSKQTILNWLRWLGTLHPATILTRAGIKGSGYLQEDEGFEKEPNLRTYTVIMVDPQSLTVWHADYVDRVDEETLSGSFENFLKKINFNIIGVTKDKWQASTNALKKVFHRIWIGYCHRHCLNNFRQALKEYQKETGCSDKDVSRLYQQFKKVLKTSTSKANLMAKIKFLKDKAFSHPILQKRLSELKENAVHYTSHKNRKGITQTTSIVDNYMKLIKRKLRQVESFRDKSWAGLFFRAQANIRNFVPFGPGAKNSHKSPFMLAGGETYDLSWIQTMNVHNAFMFTEGAF